jgi:hypothetical protein
LIREISNKHDIKGFDSSPLEREKVIEFSSRLSELVRRHKVEFAKLQVRFIIRFVGLKLTELIFNRQGRESG